jgi:hypothetical protein
VGHYLEKWKTYHLSLHLHHSVAQQASRLRCVRSVCCGDLLHKKRLPKRILRWFKVQICQTSPRHDNDRPVEFCCVFTDVLKQILLVWTVFPVQMRLIFRRVLKTTERLLQRLGHSIMHTKF